MNRNNFDILANEWLEKGSHDFDEANLSFQYGGWTDIICFHCQQACEKYLKGYLVSQGINVGKIRKFHIHDLTKLWSECCKIDKSFQDIEDECILINPYYIEPRYPLGHPVVYTKQETKEALEATNKIVDFVHNKLNR